MPDGIDLSEVKQAVDSLGTTFEEFKKVNDRRLDEIEKKGASDPLDDEQLERINRAIDQYEDVNQKLTAAEQEAKAAKEAADELKERADKIETTMKRPGGLNSKADPEEMYREGVNRWAMAAYKAIAYGQSALDQDDIRALATHDKDGKAIPMDQQLEEKVLTVSTDSTGGYLAPSEYVREIIKGVTEITPFRQVARIRQTANRSVQVPKRTGQFSAQWVAEQGTRSETTGLTYGLEEIHAHEMYALIDISEQNLEDTAFDMESEIRMESTEQFAVLEGKAFIDGNAVGKPEGILTNSDVGETVSGSASAISDTNGQANGLIDLFHDIKTAYARNAVWGLNRGTIASVRKLKDGNNNYIWQPGLASGIPNTILGAPYVEMPDMPDVAANAYPIVFGDFRRAYTIVDRTMMSILRDPYTQATSGNIRFVMRRRVGGQVVLAEAIRKLKVST